MCTGLRHLSGEIGADVILKRLGQLILWVADAGTPEGEGPETRRIRVLNLSALSGALLNSGFTVLFVVNDLDSVRPVLLPNTLWSLGYVAVILLSATGRRKAPIWVLFVTGVTNLVGLGLFFGLAGLAWMYLVILAAMGALFVPRHDRMLAVVVIGGGALAGGLTALFAGDPPPFLQGTALSDFVRFFIPTTTSLVLAGIAFFYRTVAERAEARSEELLLNILPPEIAVRLKAGESPIADRIPEVTILFCDIVGSTSMAERMSPDELVTKLDRLFSSFDDISDTCGLEKIKTIGDEYFAVAGLNGQVGDPAAAAARAALLMREELKRQRSAGFADLQMRFGLHTGPVVAGVIGKRKFSYDMWGDTVNIASRMESSSDADHIQVSQAVYERLKDRFRFETRGDMPIKGKGTFETYLLLGSR
jgi:class 3 adenylate cyclase